MQILLAIIFLSSLVVNQKAIVSAEVSGHSSGYHHADPLGSLEVAVPMTERSQVFVRHMSSIPDSTDNDFGGINMYGVRVSVEVGQ